MKEAGLHPVEFRFSLFFIAIFKQPFYGLKEIEKGGQKGWSAKVVRTIKEAIRRIGPAKGGYWEILL